MNFKRSLCTSILLITSHAYADVIQLTDFDMIKNSLLNGQHIQMVVNLEKSCELLTDDTNGGPATAPNTFGGLLTTFAINYKNGHVQSGFGYLNAPDEKYPGNYQTVEIDLSPANKINLQLKIVTLPKYKVIKDTRWNCTVADKNNEGVRFFTASH